MRLTMLKSKIHRATVTDADLNYEGSISIDSTLCEAARLNQFERVEGYFFFFLHVLGWLRIARLSAEPTAGADSGGHRALENVPAGRVGQVIFANEVGHGGAEVRKVPPRRREVRCDRATLPGICRAVHGRRAHRFQEKRPASAAWWGGFFDNGPSHPRPAPVPLPRRSLRAPEAAPSRTPVVPRIRPCPRHRDRPRWLGGGCGLMGFDIGRLQHLLDRVAAAGSRNRA